MKNVPPQHKTRLTARDSLRLHLLDILAALELGYDARVEGRLETA